MELAGGRRLRAEPLQVRHVDDRREWDELIVGFDDHSVQQSFHWGEFKRHGGWMPTRLAATADGRCLAAMSVLTRRLPGSGSSAMYAPRGPLVHGRESQPALAALLEEVRGLAGRQRAVFLRVSPGRLHDEPVIAEMLDAGGFVPLPEDYTTWNNPRIVMSLPLAGGEPTVRLRMRKKTRQAIGVAARRGVKIRDGGSREDFQELHHLISQNARRKGLPTRRRGHYEALSSFVRAGAGRLSFAEANGVRIAAQFSVRFGDRVHCLFYGVCPEHLHLEAARALDWDHITWALACDCREIDFGGSGTCFPPKATDRGYGVYRYKTGLGCEIRYLTGYYDLVFRPSRYWMFRLLERRLLPMAWRLRSRF